MYMLSKRTRWLTVARSHIGSHQDPSTETDGSASSQASMSTPAPVPLFRAPPGPAVSTSRIAQSAPVAEVANTLVPLMTQPFPLRATVVPNRLLSPGLGACGSPLQATHFSPRWTTPLNHLAFCASVPSASISTSELVCPSQHRPSDRSAPANRLVNCHNAYVSPCSGPMPMPPYRVGTVGASRPASHRSAKSASG